MRRRRRQRTQALNGLNLTSLLDITFVLLIAFMVVAPALTQSMDVELPEADAPEDVAPPPKPSEIVVVAVEYGGDPAGPHPLYANKERLVDLGELRELARRWADTDSPLFLEIDWRVPFGTYLQTARALQDAGITNPKIVYREPN